MTRTGALGWRGGLAGQPQCLQPLGRAQLDFESVANITRHHDADGHQRTQGELNAQQCAQQRAAKEMPQWTHGAGSLLVCS